MYACPEYKSMVFILRHVDEFILKLNVLLENQKKQLPIMKMLQLMLQKLLLHSNKNKLTEINKSLKIFSLLELEIGLL